MKKHLLILAMLSASSTAMAEPMTQAEPAVEFSGSANFEFRAFTDQAPHDNQRNGTGLSVAFEPEFYYETEEGSDSLTFKPFLRLDPSDENRRHADVRELKWLHADDDWELLIGWDKVFWGVAESNHLVDMINQTDLVDNPNSEEKLGQAMVQYAMLKDWGTVRFFALPGSRKRTYPGVNGRFRSGLVVDDNQAVYESGAGENRMDLALRYEHTLGDWDFGLAHFNGTSREARLMQGKNAIGEDILVQHYDVIDQSSVDVQYTTDAWLWKFEGITRSGHGKRFEAAVGGLEYTFYGINDSDADLGLLLEYHSDGRSAGSPQTQFDNDVFTAFRYVLNDIDDTEILAGMLYDTETAERSYSVEASSRFADNYKVTLEGGFFSGESAVKTEDYIQLNVARYF